jgi:DNA invertase Pin-like site-specific DNA recombinase
MVTRLDRLARSTRDLLNVLDAVAKRNAGFRSLADAWADTTTPHGRLMLTVLGGLAEFERELIRARTDEGRKRAQARGVRFGRKRKLTVHQQQEALARRTAGEALVDIARFLCSLALNSFWRWKSRNRAGRPKVDRELRDLIRRMSKENPLWGAPRIYLTSRIMITGQPQANWKTRGQPSP